MVCELRRYSSTTASTASLGSGADRCRLRRSDALVPRYDPMGRPLVEARTNFANFVPGSVRQEYTTSYTYYLDGSLYTLTYPSGDVVGYGIGGGERYTSLGDASNAYTYFAQYTAAGSLWFADRSDVYPTSFTNIFP